MNVWIPVLMAFGAGIMLINFFMRLGFISMVAALVFAALFWQILASIAGSSNPTTSNPLWLVALAVGVLTFGNIILGVGLWAGSGRRKRY